MSSGSAQHDRFLELAQLPAGNPARAQLESAMQSMDPQSRAQWQHLLDETDQFHTQLAQLPMPAALAQTLVNIPTSQPPLPKYKHFLQQPVGWKHLAASAAIILAIVGSIYWYMQPTVPKRLSVRLADQIATFAIQNHQHASLEITSDDSAKVQTALAAHHLGIDPAVLQPSTPMQLQGGGIAYLDQTPVAFTRWKAGAESYTLYEFNGKPLGVPGSFVPTTDTPGNNPNSPRVLIWPGVGNQGTWALVLENNSATDYFSDHCR